jgi:hypothetical protein
MGCLTAMLQDTKRAFVHDCPKCRYLFSIHSGNNHADVYESCTTGFIIRLGEGADYLSSVTLDLLVWGFLRGCDSRWKEEEPPDA